DAFDARGHRQHGRYRRRARRRNLEIDAAVRAPGVVVHEIAGEDTLQVRPVPDQRPVQTLSTHGAYPPLGIRVRSGRPRWDLDCLNADRGEYRVERGGELGVAVADQEAESIDVVGEVHQQVAPTLAHPGTGRVGGNAGQ